MPESPRASIIINNYNYGRFVGEAIESALRQTYENTEVIVVDDGSTDDSREVISGFGRRVKPIFKENGGQGSAFNVGFAECSGDVICFLDADDLLAPGALKEATATFQDSEIVKVEWRLRLIDESGRQTGDVVPEKPLPNDDMRETTIRNGPFYDWLITPPSSGNSYSRRLLKQVFPMNEPPYRHGADVYLTMLSPIYGQIRRLPTPQGFYRIHSNNNYYGRSLDEKRLCDYQRRFESCCSELSEHLRRQGVDVDTLQWRRRNFNYLWPTRLLKGKEDLASILPDGCTFILLNGGQWNPRDLIPGRHPLAFLERDGEYWGLPANDEVALSELERLREKGAAFFVIWWTEFWSLEHYPRLRSCLRTQFKCVLDNDRLVAFDLRN